MIKPNRKISVRELNPGDMVVGKHVDGGVSIKIVAGEIDIKSTDKESVIYFIKGKILQNPFGHPINLSGTLTENEVEVIDPVVCNSIVELYEIANRQMIDNNPQYHNTVEKINIIRTKSRQELEEKYMVADETMRITDTLEEM